MLGEIPGPNISATRRCARQAPMYRRRLRGVPPTASTTGRADYWNGYRADRCPKSRGPIISLLDPGSGKANSLLRDKNSLLRSLGNFF